MLYGAPFLDHAFSSDMLYAMLLHAVMQSYNSEDNLSSAEHQTRISILFHLSHCTRILVLEPHFNHISRLREGFPWRNVTRLWCIRKVVSYWMINSTFALARWCLFYQTRGVNACFSLDRHQLRRSRHSTREGESNGNYKVLRVAISNRSY